MLARAVTHQIAHPPAHARVVVCERTFPTGMLGHHVRRLAEAGLVGVLTATSPARLGPPGGPKVAGTNPLAIGIPGGVVVDVSMGAVTWGDVIAGLADEEQLVPFGGEQWHKAFALAVGLQLFVDALVTRAGSRRGAARRAARGGSGAGAARDRHSVAGRVGSSDSTLAQARRSSLGRVVPVHRRQDARPWTFRGFRLSFLAKPAKSW